MRGKLPTSQKGMWHHASLAILLIILTHICQQLTAVNCYMAAHIYIYKIYFKEALMKERTIKLLLSAAKFS